MSASRTPRGTLVPALDATVAREDGTLGLVVTHPYPEGATSTLQVTVEWDDEVTVPELVDDLLTEPGTCTEVLHRGSRYTDPEPDEVCGEPTVPGDELCPAHGGRAFL